MATEWDILPGTTLPRRELHARHGGGWYGGMEPAVKSNSMLLFSKPAAGEAFGYVYDGWQEDGTFHYTGDGQVGDQSPDEGGNKSLLSAADLGRTIRLFSSERKNTTYIGAFTLGDPAYRHADAQDRNKEMRSVLVFHLVPDGEVYRRSIDVAPVLAESAEQILLEAVNADTYVAEHPDEPAQAVRREANLVVHYATWLKSKGQNAARHRIAIPEGGYLFTDVYNTTTKELLEAKASTARVYVRTALGQILDYSRYVEHRSRALLLPEEPPADLVTLLHDYKVGVVWRAGQTYQRSDPS